MSLNWAEHSKLIVNLCVMIWELVGGPKEKAYNCRFWGIKLRSPGFPASSLAKP